MNKQNKQNKFSPEVREPQAEENYRQTQDNKTLMDILL